MCAKSAHVPNLLTCEHSRIGRVSQDEVYLTDEDPRRLAMATKAFFDDRKVRCAKDTAQRT
jgi:hypothetical protein